MKRTKLRLGLDLDGVVANSRALKSLICFELFQKEIPPKHCGGLAMRSYLSLEEYECMREKAYLAREYVLSMKPIPGAIKAIATITRIYDISIVTSRRVNEVPFVYEWLNMHGLSITVVGVGCRDKRAATQGMDIFVDDDDDKLRMIDVPKKFLFSGEHNIGSSVHDTDFIRVYSWKDLQDILVNLSA